MARRNRLTARSERRSARIRDIAFNSELARSVLNNNYINIISNSNRIVDDGIDVLNDSFKCELNLVPRYFESFDCGSLELICRFCNAKSFNSEITQGDRNAFSLCCHKGKVNIALPSRNQFFEELYNGLNSNDRIVKKRSKNYFDNIRSYNSSFAMVSSEAKILDTILNGIYHFKIHDTFYHRIGPLLSQSGRSPCYAQLYFYDVDTANQYRMRERYNQDCDNSLMTDISVELDNFVMFL